MSFIDAVNALEGRCEKLGVRFPDGSMMPGVVVMGRVGKYHGKRYDKVINDLDEGKISVETYFLEMMKMIFEYGNRQASE